LAARLDGDEAGLFKPLEVPGNGLTPHGEVAGDLFDGQRGAARHGQPQDVAPRLVGNRAENGVVGFRNRFGTVSPDWALVVRTSITARRAPMSMPLLWRESGRYGQYATILLLKIGDVWLPCLF
jgi:hypothetical protein